MLPFQTKWFPCCVAGSANEHDLWASIGVATVSHLLIQQNINNPLGPTLHIYALTCSLP